MSPLDVDGVCERMSAETLRRFRVVWGIMFDPPTPVELACVRRREQTTRRTTFTAAHAQELVSAGVATRVDRIGALDTVPFTVYEERASGARQRPIFWTRGGNELAALRGYVAQVPLPHVSALFPGVLTEAATTRDLKASFFQVEIPLASRPFFTFADDTGAAYALERMPMGHACAPEIMHFLTAALGGVHGVVAPQFEPQDVHVEAWIDNLRFTGSKTAVAAAAERVDAELQRVRGTWNDADATTAATQYGFIGVEWCHGTGRVRVSRKLWKKLSDVDLAQPMRADDYESFVCRLLYAASIAGVAPGAYWWAIKHARRVMNALNRGVLQVGDAVQLSPAVRRIFARWRVAVQGWRRITPAWSAVSRSCTLFVDASKKGWGGVFVSADGELAITGALWKADEAALHINILEAITFARAIPALVTAPLDALDVYVDNTTVIGVSRKGISEVSEALTAAVLQALHGLSQLDAPWRLSYVATDKNPADLPSRKAVSSWSARDRTMVRQQVTEFFGG